MMEHNETVSLCFNKEQTKCPIHKEEVPSISAKLLFYMALPEQFGRPAF
jgi:hypothetical protein